MLPFWIALQFLSSLPVRLAGMPPPQAMGRSLLCYPLVGLLFGGLLWALNLLLAGSPALLHAALLLGAWVLLSGGLHLDGLADSADAWLGSFGGLGVLGHPYDTLAVAASALVIYYWGAATGVPAHLVRLDADDAESEAVEHAGRAQPAHLPHATTR